MTPKTDSVAVLRELLDEYPAPNFTAERAALTAAIAVLEAQGEAVYQCMCTDEDDVPNGPRDIWMDVDRESFDKLRQRDDVRSRVLYLHPAAPGGEVTDLPAKWRKEADGFMAYTTAPHGRTWDHGAADAKREDARQLEEALAARTGKGEG